MRKPDFERIIRKVVAKTAARDRQLCVAIGRGIASAANEAGVCLQLTDEGAIWLAKAALKSLAGYTKPEEA